MSKNRVYNYKDVDMLMASKTIAESFKASIAELALVRSDWTPEYADNLLLRIDDSIENNLGVDAKKSLRKATATLTSIQAPALRDLSFFKIQIDDDFKKEPALQNEILKTLGFPKLLKKVQSGNQEALIELLYAFKKNMSEELKTKITSKGLNPALIERIIGNADTFIDANVSQETLKESSKEITFGIIQMFNAIYDEIIGICKKASAYYKYEPLKKEQFTFRKVISNLGAIQKSSNEKSEI